MHQPIRRRLGLLVARAAAACLVLVAAGCAQPHPTLAQLREVPEASLHPPGSVLVRRGGSDSDRKNFGGVNPAVLDDLYATDEDPASVLAYYRSHLGDAWVEDRNAGVLRSEWVDADAWQSPGYLLQVGIADAGYRRRATAALPKAVGMRTLFAVSLQASP